MKKLLTILGLAGLFALPLQAQLTSPRIATLLSSQMLTNAQLLTVGVSTNILNSFTYTHDISIETTVVSTNSVSVGTVTNYFDFCLDAAPGSNFTTTMPQTTTVAANGTNTVRSVTLIAKTAFDGAQQIRLTKTGTSTTNNVTVTVRVGQIP